MSLEWFTLFFAAFTGIAGYLGRMFYDRKKELRDEATKERRTIYKKFIEIAIDQLSNRNTEDLDGRMFDFYKTYLLYASPDVINAMGEYQQHVMHQDVNNPDLNGQYKKQAKVIYEMREDLGLSIKNLGSHGQHVFKTILTNYDEVFSNSQEVKYSSNQ